MLYRVHVHQRIRSGTVDAATCTGFCKAPLVNCLGRAGCTPRSNCRPLHGMLDWQLRNVSPRRRKGGAGADCIRSCSLCTSRTGQDRPRAIQVLATCWRTGWACRWDLWQGGKYGGATYGTSVLSYGTSGAVRRAITWPRISVGTVGRRSAAHGLLLSQPGTIRPLACSACPLSVVFLSPPRVHKAYRREPWKEKRKNGKVEKWKSGKI